MRRSLPSLQRASNGAWVAVIFTLVLGVMNFWKLIAVDTYPYGYPDYSAYQLDPMLGFAVGVLALMVCGYLIGGLLHNDVWPAIAAAVWLPGLYMVTFSGAATALWVAGALALIFGAQAVGNYRRKFRRLT
jgi:hypothetical protein